MNDSVAELEDRQGAEDPFIEIITLQTVKVSDRRFPCICGMFRIVAGTIHPASGDVSDTV